MNEHNKKIIAPVIVVFAIILYYVVGVNIVLRIDFSNAIKICILIFSIIITIILIVVLIERIKEIKQGEEDDLSKYWLYHWERIGNNWTC